MLSLLVADPPLSVTVEVIEKLLSATKLPPPTFWLTLPLLPLAGTVAEPVTLLSAEAHEIFIELTVLKVDQLNLTSAYVPSSVSVSLELQRATE